MELNRDLSIYSLEYDLSPIYVTAYNCWGGALLRNNLLYAASTIHLYSGHSLLDIINGDNQNNEYSDIPRGYAIQCPRLMLSRRISPSESFIFRIQLFGKLADYAEYFHQAVVAMCARGIGHPMIPLQIVGHRRAPIVIKSEARLPKQIRIEFITPVSLYNNRAKSLSKQGALDKQNGVPIFYFLVKNLYRRISKLQMFYGIGELASDDQIDAWCNEARKACTEQCSFTRVVLQGPPQKGRINPIHFTGYTGNMILSHVAPQYIPFLQIGTYTNVGGDTVYGLGQYELLTR